jgi:hypothetical protein
MNAQLRLAWVRAFSLGTSTSPLLLWAAPTYPVTNKRHVDKPGRPALLVTGMRGRQMYELEQHSSE